MKWLLFGYTSHFKPLSREHVAATRERAGGRDEVLLHVNPISYSELRFSLEKAGFEVQGAFRDRRKPRLWLYAPITLLIQVAGADRACEEEARALDARAEFQCGVDRREYAGDACGEKCAIEVLRCLVTGCG